MLSGCGRSETIRQTSRALLCSSVWDTIHPNKSGLLEQAHWNDDWRFRVPRWSRHACSSRWYIDSNTNVLGSTNFLKVKWFFFVIWAVVATMCQDEMGLSNGQLADSQIIVSSMNPLQKIAHTRLGSPKFWRPALEDPRQYIIVGSFRKYSLMELYYKNTRQYVSVILTVSPFQIDFWGPRSLSGVSFNSESSRMVTKVKVEYSQDKTHWNDVQLLVSANKTNRSFLWMSSPISLQLEASRNEEETFFGMLLSWDLKLDVW